MAKTDQAQKRLARALRRLNPVQGRVARTNARKEALAALRAVREAMDEEYPPVRAKVTRARLSASAREKRLTDKGFVKVGSRTVGNQTSVLSQPWSGIPHSIVTACAAAGVRVILIRNVERGANVQQLWVPKWAQLVGGDVVKLQRLRRDLAARKAFMAEQALATASPTEAP